MVRASTDSAIGQGTEMLILPGILDFMSKLRVELLLFPYESIIFIHSFTVNLFNYSSKFGYIFMAVLDTMG